MTSADAVAVAVRKMVAECLADASWRRISLHEPILAAAEKPLIEAVLTYHGGNQVRAALTLGISRNTLHKKIRVHGIGR